MIYMKSFWIDQLPADVKNLWDQLDNITNFLVSWLQSVS